MPFVLFKTILDLDPNHQNPTLRAIARIWKHEAIVPRDRERRQRTWTLDHIGVGPNPSDYVDGVATPGQRAAVAAAVRICVREPAHRSSRCRQPRRRPTTRGLLARARLSEHESADRQAANRDKEENWERDRPDFGSPGSMDRVFFSCAACHVGRVMVAGKMKFLPGMPNTEIEAQYYSKLLMLTGAALVESGFDPASTTPVNPAAIKPNTSAVRALYTRDAGQGAAAAGNAVRLVAGANRAREDSDAGGRRRVPERHAGSHRRRREDALHLSRRGEEQRATSGRSPTSSRTVPGRWMRSASPRVSSRFTRAGPTTAFWNSCVETIPKSPFFTGFSKANGLPADIPGMTDAVTDAKAAADRIFKNIPAWAPPVPAPIDIKSVNWATERYPRQLGRQPGRLVAHAGVRRVGDRRSAHGQRAHPRAAQPVHRQPAAAAYPVRQCRPGAGARGQGDSSRRNCATLPHAAQPDDLPGLDAWRRRRIGRW